MNPDVIKCPFCFQGFINGNYEISKLNVFDKTTEIACYNENCSVYGVVFKKDIAGLILGEV